VDKVVEIVQAKYGLNEAERGSVLNALVESGDLTKYGLANAVTRVSQDLDDYDRATSFERMGGEIIELDKKDWQVFSEN